MEYGTTIKTLRIRRGLKQNEFARRLDISGNYLSSIENNKVRPSLHLIGKTALVFDISLGEFVAMVASPDLITHFPEPTQRAQVTELLTKALTYFMSDASVFTP